MLLLLVAVSFAQQPGLRDIMEAQAEKQRQAISSSMSASLEIQKRSIRRQVETAAEDAFLVVPMPARHGEPMEVTDAACDPLAPAQVAPLVARSAHATGLAPSLLHAVIEQESAYRPCAISRAGAVGLMQLMPGTARGLGVTDPMDPDQNIEAGSRYLKELMDRYAGNLIMALAAYNAGPARVDAAGGLPPITETGRYVDRVLKRTLGESPGKLQ